jgi:hypothetical protein
VIGSDARRVEALLDILDPNRPQNPAAGPQLVVLGLAVLSGKDTYRPTTAGWNLLGDLGHPFKGVYWQMPHRLVRRAG